MPPLVKDYLEFQKIEYLNSISVANADACLKNYHTTDGLTDLLSRIFDTMASKLAAEESPLQTGPISTLLTGGYGTGKSHMLAVIYSLLTSPKPVAPSLGDPRIQSSVVQLRKVNPLTIWIDLNDSPGISLPELILSRIEEEFEKRFQKQWLDPKIIPGINLLKAHEIITFQLTTEGPICLLIDGLSSRALNRTVPELNEDIEFLSFMGFSSKATPLYLLASAHEDFFSPTSPLGIDSVLMAQTLENFRIEWIDRTNLREIVCRIILRKNIRQKQDLGKIYSFIKLKLPNFQISERDFIEAYPYHPLIFELAEKIRGKVPSFSLIDFVINTYPRIASHRAISLATLDYLFDRIEYDLKGSHSLKPLYEIYSRLSEKTLARQQSRWKLWGKMLLKAIFLHTMADRSPSVRELADSLLLFEDSEAGLSYNAVGMLLAQMEKDADLDMSSSGERLDRTYRLRVADAREEFDKYLDSIAAQVHDQDPRLGQTLLLAAERFFPDWPIRRAPFKGQMQESIPLSVHWNGTSRPGLFLFSQRFVERKAVSPEPGSPLEFSSHLPELLPLASFDESPEPPADNEAESPEWVFCMEPVGLAPEVAAVRPEKITEVRWVPGTPSRDELVHLKKILALHLADQSVSSRLPNHEMQRIRDDFKLDLGSLFQELYLSRARILTRDQDQALNQRHYECRTFQAFLNYIFKPNFRELYPLHPEFQENHLTPEHVLVLSRKLFSAQAPTDTDVQKLAGQYALPLGLVSRLDHLYELNLTITPPPFITVVFQYLETLNTAEYSVEFVARKLHQSPFGLTPPSFQLILSALVADGQIELVDPSTGMIISRENLSSLEDFRPLTVFRKIQTHREFPTEVLTQWVRMITGNQEITDISATRGRNAATASLREWLEHWRLLGISRNLENLPNQIITTQMWTRMAWTKRRFDQVAEIVETVLAGQMTLIQGMAKVIDLFSENVGLLEKASKNLVELSLFLDWLDFFAKARNYILASEKTESPEIEQHREKLHRWLHAPHELVETEKSRDFENVFTAFRGLYIDYYAVRHDQCLGPMGNFELLREVESSPEFRNLQLLSSLPMGDSTYLDYLDEWIALVRSIRCGLPVREILWEKPHCQCGFKLSRPMSIPRIVEDFRNFIDLGTTHHRQVLDYFRDRIESRLNEAGDLPPGQVEEIRTLLRESTFPPLTQSVIDQIAEMVGNIVVEEKLSSPLPALAPAGRITKKHLQNRIQKWLDSLSDQDDVLLSFREE